MNGSSLDPPSEEEPPGYECEIQYRKLVLALGRRDINLVNQQHYQINHAFESGEMPLYLYVKYCTIFASIHSLRNWEKAQVRSTGLKFEIPKLTYRYRQSTASANSAGGCSSSVRKIAANLKPMWRSANFAMVSTSSSS
jgi:hypothetical protein